MDNLAYLYGKPEQHGLLKTFSHDFQVFEHLGYELSGEGEFVIVDVRKENNNTLFVAEQLAKFAGISARDVSYAGLKDRHAITQQVFCLHLPGKNTPNFEHFQLDGVEVLNITRHHRKIRIGSLAGNYFILRLRNVVESPALLERLIAIKQQGFPNYFMEQRFGKDGQNIEQAMRWANGEIKVKERKKRSFYLSAARSFLFNLILSQRIAQQTALSVKANDIVQLNGSSSWFVANDTELSELQQRLTQQDIGITGALIGDNLTQINAISEEREIVEQYPQLAALMQKERLTTDRRLLIAQAKDLQWQFDHDGLELRFFLHRGSYATALIRELIIVDEQNNQ